MPRVSTAGSATRLNRSPNRQSGSAAAHRCSFAWIPSTRARAVFASGHGAPVFTGGLLAFQPARCRHAASLRHVRGFPAPGLLRRLRPVPGPSADGVPARHRPGRPGRRAAPRRFPRSPRTGRRARCPAIPRQPSHEYAAGIPRDHRPGQHLGRAGVDQPVPRSTARCFPARIHQVRAGFLLTGVPPLVHTSCTFSSRSPDPHRLAVPVHPGFVRAAPTLPGASRIRLPSASPACCDRPGAGPSIPPGPMAPRGALEAV